MGKKCSICGNKHYLKELTNGYGCAKCMRIYQGVKQISSDELKNLWKENEKRLEIFNTTQEISGFAKAHIVIDYNNELFYLDVKKKDLQPIVFKFREIESYKTEVVGQKQVTKTKGGITRAVIGGAIAGPIGSVIGANTSKQETVVSGGDAVLTINLNSIYGKYELKVMFYPNELPRFLDECIENNKNKKDDVATVADLDTLKKYKELLDCGAITEEEFMSKKEKILNTTNNINTEETKKEEVAKEIKKEESVSKINIESVNNKEDNEEQVSEKNNKWTIFALCFFLGYLGVHKFYEGKIGMGILYLCTFGLFGFGWLIDLILILTKK